MAEQQCHSIPCLYFLPRPTVNKESQNHPQKQNKKKSLHPRPTAHDLTEHPCIILMSFQGGCQMGLGISGRSRNGRTWISVEGSETLGTSGTTWQWARRRGAVRSSRCERALGCAGAFCSRSRGAKLGAERWVGFSDWTHFFDVYTPTWNSESSQV